MASLRLRSVEEKVSLLKTFFFCAPLVVAGILILRSGDSDAAWGWLFIAAGVGWYLYALRLAMSVAKFGEAYLDVETPVRLNAALAARLVCPGGLPGRDIEAEFSCREVYWRHERTDLSEDTLTERVLWFAKERFPIVGRSPGSEAHISFQLPGNQPATDQPSDMGNQLAPGHYWELILSAKAKGVDFIRRYRVPVTR